MSWCSRQPFPNLSFYKLKISGFPGSPVFKTSPSNAGGTGLIPMPQRQKTKQKHYCNKVNKDFKNGPHEKNPFKKLNQSVQFSHSVISDCLQPHGLEHTGLPSPAPSHRAYSNSYPLSR
ncbi:unnamed protein product [Rangifer tarandus platyrhynchus]|uniref:Uncharacterized protein n=1 Tax=Rangifer tarandus platyrhynchus TaxID=3082113 RepID=A0AC59Z4W3_RANTA